MPVQADASMKDAKGRKNQETVTIVLVALSIFVVAFELKKRLFNAWNNNYGDKSDDTISSNPEDNERDDSYYGKVDISVAHFDKDNTNYPWEPTTAASTIYRNEYGENGKCLMKQNATAEETLQFLSTMTFANGGLRAPSCPCCV